MFIKALAVQFFFLKWLIWFWYWGYVNFIECVKKNSCCFNLLENKIVEN